MPILDLNDLAIAKSST